MLIIDQQIRDGSNDEHGPEDTQMFSNVDIDVYINAYNFRRLFLTCIWEHENPFPQNIHWQKIWTAKNIKTDEDLFRYGVHNSV